MDSSLTLFPKRPARDPKATGRQLKLFSNYFQIEFDQNDIKGVNKYTVKFEPEIPDNSKELNECADLFIPIMHTIMLIWTYSQYYNTPSRLVVLIREICNAIINRCRNYIDGEKIFAFIKGEEAKEAHDKLTLALDVCSKFKDAYFEYKAKSKNQWKITTNALFVRLDTLCSI